MAQLADELLPQHLKERVNTVKCDPEVREYYGTDWSCYNHMPETGGCPGRC